MTLITWTCSRLTPVLPIARSRAYYPPSVLAKRDVVRRQLFTRPVFTTKTVHEITSRKPSTQEESRRENGGYIGETSKVDGVWRIVVGLSLIPAFGTLYQRLTLPESVRFKKSQGHGEHHLNDAHTSGDVDLEKRGEKGEKGSQIGSSGDARDMEISGMAGIARGIVRRDAVNDRLRRIEAETNRRTEEARRPAPVQLTQRESHRGEAGPRRGMEEKERRYTDTETPDEMEGEDGEQPTRPQHTSLYASIYSLPCKPPP